MDSQKTGALIRDLRIEMGLTQKQLADRLCLSDKTVSKWETGQGCPDISLLTQLAQILNVSLDALLRGDAAENGREGGNMKRSKYYVCPVCGGITLCTGNAEVTCCGRKLTMLEPQKAEESEKLRVETVEDDWYITSDCPMTKDNYISFVAFATGERIEVYKQYPEWELSVRIPRRGHGTLIWYCGERLYYQYL